MTNTVPATLEQEKQIEVLAALILKESREQIARDYPDSLWLADAETVAVKPGKVYTRIDRGPERNMSGYLMIEHATGTVFGIKAYGVPHRKKAYGTLDTIGDWYWGGYSPQKRPAL